MKKKSHLVTKILFLTGLPSSGKTSLALSLKKEFEKKGFKKIKYIDGDSFRKKFKLDQYDNKSRNLVGDEKIKFAKSFLKFKKLVIVTGVAHNKSWRKKIKKKNKNLLEIYTKCPIKVCLLRDYKKNYFKAKNNKIKNFVGINYEYQEGKTVDLTLDMYKNTLKFNTNKLFNFLIKNRYVY